MNKTRKAWPLTRRGRRVATSWPTRPRKIAARPRPERPAADAERVEPNRALEAQLAALQEKQQELHHALFEAAQVQRKLCAPREVRRGRFEIASELFPVRYISGDFYDVLDLGAATGLAVGDIAGKGLAAGLWFTHFIGLIRTHAVSHPDPASMMAAINRDLCQTHPPMASLFFGRLDPRRGELVYCSAGHPPALLLRRDGTAQPLQEGSPILGALSHASFSTGRVVVKPGDALIAYSDGLLECRNGRDQEFGTEGLLAAARSAGCSSASAMLFSVLGAVQDFAGSHPREDDFALMIVRRLERG